MADAREQTKQEHATRGWFWPPSGTRKAHYFNGSGQAVCVKYMLWPGVFEDLHPRNFEDHGDDSPDNCAACKKAVAKLREAEAGDGN